MECNFKVTRKGGRTAHVFNLRVICDYFEDLGYIYSVEGQAYGAWNDLMMSSETAGGNDIDTFKTPEEAVAFARRIAEKYPRYGNGRDYKADLAPEYMGVDK